MRTRAHSSFTQLPSEVSPALILHFLVYMKNATLIAVLFLAVSVWATVSVAKQSYSAAQREARVEHAHELLGKYYARSEARNGEAIKRINNHVYHWTKERLPREYKADYKKIAQQSAKYQYDPVFLLSVIQRESRFNPEIKGSAGEIGLMQIKPETAKWICEKFGIEWHGSQSLYDPMTNIEIGSAYLNSLRDRFESHAQLYLAAYNMGQRNVDELRAQKRWPKDYPSQVMKHYIEFYSELGNPTAESRRKKKKLEVATESRKRQPASEQPTT